MRFFGNMSRSGLFVVFVLLAVVLGGGAYLLARMTDAPHVNAERLGAAPVSTMSPAALQVIMSGLDTSAATDSQAASETAEVPAGAETVAGVDGAPGADGAAGVDGATGPEGPQGPEGPAGSVGATGPAGSIGATGPAGVGLTPVDHDGGGFEVQSPDGVSYRIHVTNQGIFFEGPTTTEVWSDTSHFQTLVP